MDGQTHKVGHLLGRKRPSINREAHDNHHRDGKNASDKALDKGLGVKYVGHVALRRANRAQDANFLFTLEHADIRDDADHDGTHHQANAHKSDKHQADGVHDVGHRAHDDAHVVGVGNHPVLVACGLRALVVIVDMRKHALLRLKVARKDLDGDGIVLVGVPQRGEIVVIGELRCLSVVHHE